ncbi:hypothetical protein [Apibacter sp. HY039]|uniref:hypothetical protein n=1 Tax=Apibacter sp. HY039 TaxID=2501476 RepID=UPI000FEB917B|nr:hypothetical protein [Apibacter sp. HY039]
MQKWYILVFVNLILSCNREVEMPKGTKYYESFSGYNHPVQMINEISFHEVEHLQSYIKSTYKNQKLQVVEKYINNRLFFKYVYTYEKNKLIKVELSNNCGYNKTVNY